MLFMVISIFLVKFADSYEQCIEYCAFYLAAYCTVQALTAVE